MAASRVLARIERYLLEEARAVGSHWQTAGRFGVLCHPALSEERFNHIRPLGRQPFAPEVDPPALREACALLAEAGRRAVVVVEPARAVAMLVPHLQEAGFAHVGSELLMAHVADDSAPAVARRVQVGPLTADGDLGDYARLWNRAFRGEGTAAWLAAFEAALRDEISSREVEYVAARDENRLVGTGALSLHRGAAEIVGIGVAEELRGQGIGTAVVRYLIGLARARGAGLVFLVVEAGNPAERLYHRLGFRLAGLRQYWRRA